MDLSHPSRVRRRHPLEISRDPSPISLSHRYIQPVHASRSSIHKPCASWSYFLRRRLEPPLPSRPHALSLGSSSPSFFLPLSLTHLSLPRRSSSRAIAPAPAVDRELQLAGAAAGSNPARYGPLLDLGCPVLAPSCLVVAASPFTLPHPGSIDQVRCPCPCRHHC